MFIKSKNIIPYICIAVVGILCAISLGVLIYMSVLHVVLTSQRERDTNSVIIVVRR